MILMPDNKIKRCEMVNITDTARDKLRELLDKNPGKYLRVAFQGFG
jgi:Fe-S cluster assembly iron-binding protein IscA